jgi:hypothetical protein
LNFEYKITNIAAATHKVDDSETNVGFFGGFGYTIPMKLFELDPKVKLHYIDGDIWFTTAIGINFGMGKK